VVLEVKKSECGEPEHILGETLQPPTIEKLRGAVRTLIEMGGVTKGTASKMCGNLTALGHLFAELPCDIGLSRLMIFGHAFGCLREAIIIASVLSTQEKKLFHLT
jgi:HrpA-like RNA helicase